jgi:hypothetical protein
LDSATLESPLLWPLHASFSTLRSPLPAMSGPVDRERRASNDDVRSHIVNSLFWRKADDGTPEETLISYTKVYEEDPGDVQAGAKTRYLMLAGKSAGRLVWDGLDALRL